MPAEQAKDQVKSRGSNQDKTEEAQLKLSLHMDADKKWSKNYYHPTHPDRAVAV